MAKLSVWLDAAESGSDGAETARKETDQGNVTEAGRRPLWIEGHLLSEGVKCELRPEL